MAVATPKTGSHFREDGQSYAVCKNDGVRIRLLPETLDQDQRKWVHVADREYRTCKVVRDAHG